MKKLLAAILCVQACAGVDVAEDRDVRGELRVEPRVGVASHDDDQFFTERCWLIWDELRDDAIAAGQHGDVKALESMRFEWLMTMDSRSRQLPPKLADDRYNWDDDRWTTWEYTNQHGTIPMRCGRDLMRLQLNRGESVLMKVALSSSVDESTMQSLEITAGRWEANVDGVQVANGTSFLLPEASRVTGYITQAETKLRLYVPNVGFEVPAGARDVTLLFTASQRGLTPFEQHWNDHLPQLIQCHRDAPPTKTSSPRAIEGDAIVVGYTLSIDGAERRTISGDTNWESHRTMLESCGLPSSP